MNEIQSLIINLLPSKRKTTSGGWISVNAVCCHHRGHSQDRRQRGGVLLTDQGGFNWHCFNCGFKTGWSPGKLLSSNTKNLLKWLNLDDNELKRLMLLVLKIKNDQPVYANQAPVLQNDFKEVKLPPDSQTVNNWIAQGAEYPELLSVVDYIVNTRKFEWDWYDWFWSPEPGYRDRVLIPFYQNKKIVGYTGRKITEGKPKYLTESPSGYVFNIDRQDDKKQFLIVVEGQFDAIAIDGVAIMINEPNSVQIQRIKNLGKEVICVPDRDHGGRAMIDRAIKEQWSVSLPPWGLDIKDCSDAVARYGRLYVLTAILHYRVHGEIKLQLIKNQLPENYERTQSQL